MPRDRAEYMKQYRAKRTGQTPDSQKNDLEAAPQTAETGSGRKRKYPYGNDANDWPSIIQGMTQHQRDRILERVVKTKT